jgi:hypothetical protein
LGRAISSKCQYANQVVSNTTIANISLTDTFSSDTIDFQILLFSVEQDRYISSKILNTGVYEPEIKEFIARALNVPLGSNGSKSNSKIPSPETEPVWAVDIGANVGFHSLHMAKQGANVIAFEPAPDTCALIECSVEMLKGTGSVKVIAAGASNMVTQGVLSRHPDSPGMTTFKSSSEVGFPV